MKVVIIRGGGEKKGEGLVGSGGKGIISSFHPLLLLSCSFSRKYTHPSFPSFFAQGGGGEFPSPLSLLLTSSRGCCLEKRGGGYERQSPAGKKTGGRARNMMLSDRRRQRVARRGGRKICIPSPLFPSAMRNLI